MDQRISAFERARDGLLAQHQEAGAGTFRVPSEALKGVVRQQGYRIVRGRCPDGCDAAIDFGRRVITLDAQMRQRLAEPRSARGRSIAAVAEMLGHIHCHSWQPREHYRRWWHWEAKIFAAVFLAPWRELAGHPSLRTLQAPGCPQATIWRCLCDMGRHLDVTPTFVRFALELYEVLEYDRERREIRPRQIVARRLHSLAA